MRGEEEVRRWGSPSEEIAVSRLELHAEAIAMRLADA